MPNYALKSKNADNKTRLEDLYLPYKPKRRTKGQIAIEAGLEPLADLLWNQPSHTPEDAAQQYVDESKGVADSKAALDGARAIIMERIAEDADLLEKIRHYLNRNAELSARVIQGKEHEGEKFKDYFEHDEASAKFRRTVHWPCFVVAMKASCNYPSTPILLIEKTRASLTVKPSLQSIMVFI